VERLANLELVFRAKEHEFPTVSYEDWLREAQRFLNGITAASFSHVSGQSLSVKPLYTEQDRPEAEAAIRNTLKKSGNWEMAQRAEGRSAEQIRNEIEELFSCGQGVLHLAIPPDFGREDFFRLLEGFDPGEHPILITGEQNVLFFFPLFAEWLERAGIQKEKVTGFAGWDPFAWMMKAGWDENRRKRCLNLWLEYSGHVRQQLPHLRPFYVDGIFLEQAGANPVQQLAFILAELAEGAERLEKAGWDPKDVFKSTFIGLSSGSHFFMEVAKFRAFRYLWKKFLEAYHLPAPEPVVYAETTRMNKADLDRHTNILRATDEAFAAVCGQADLLYIHPFEDSHLARRVARNTHLLLREEARMGEVADPGGGSYFLERITCDLIEKSWELFLKIEDDGGWLQWIAEDRISPLLEHGRIERKRRIATAGETLTGVNRYAVAEEGIDGRKESASTTVFTCIPDWQELNIRLKKGKSLRAIFSGEKNRNGKEFARLSEPFEQLRVRALQISKKDGRPLNALLFLSGSFPEWRRAVHFALDFLATGGISAEVAECCTSMESVERRLRKGRYRFYGIVAGDCQLANWLAVLRATRPESRWFAVRLEEGGPPLPVDAILHPGGNRIETIEFLLNLVEGERHETGF
jgi:Methylmalonyl-CoA mutase.